ncbi:microtubule organization protein AKNA [Sphaerodactylus townsendi]|uniref:microtubule organization protein AKNA n=1 Tax=Sphaerodactylus townsendi TaxID=933632 RepID=UPI0020274CCE|nr:microtubule organization protein AKNA [Sphaerodactylus townsendi]XP_048368831.1 microtubule organization protein AKNA [Sphaerodactylus townsendi]
MARALGNGWKWDRHHELHQDEEATEEDEDFEGHVAKNGEDGLAASQWDLSFTQDNPEDVGLLEELKSYQEHPGAREQSFDLDSGGEADLGSPPPDNAEYQEHDGIQEDLSPLSYWQLQIAERLSVMENEQDEVRSEGQKKRGGASEAGSDGEAYPELSYEGQYGSEYSASPEALRDPLASYKHDKSYSFISDGGEDFSDGSNISPSPSRDAPDLRTGAFAVRSLLGDSSEYPEEIEFSSPSARSPESHALSSPADSTHWTQNLLGHLSIEDLQNSPGIDAETFPESSYAENLGEPVRTVVKMASASTTQRIKAMVKPKERLLGTTGRMAMPHDIRRVGSQPPGRVRKLKADVPHGLPSKFSRQSRSLSPQGRTPQKKESSCQLHPASQVTRVVSNSSQYGRGQLNYPLPDLSKVEPRVKFPKDPETYHPPRGKSPLARSKGSRKPVIFKSPAEIVREVLLSSGEGSPQKCPVPTESVLPEEFKSPRQATELVQQLQEDYHKLLTKYAEAENTIDRLRLGAKVRLYADPPKPSQIDEMGTISQGSKVMTFSIPQIRAAEVTGRSGPALSSALSAASETQSAGLSIHQASTSLPSFVAGGNPRGDGYNSMENPFSGDRLTQVLAAQARKFQGQVESLEELIQMGRMMPQDQLKAFAKLKKAQDALEQTYLQAREEYRQSQNLQEPAGTLGDFDPDRAVEGEIFRLEMRLEELKERINKATQPATRSSSQAAPSPDSWPAQTSDIQTGSPTPSIQAPVPALPTPYPQAPVSKDSPSQIQKDVTVSSVSDEDEEDEEGLPEPLCHKQLLVEKDFDNLLDHYSSFKSLPEVLSIEQLNLYNSGLAPDAVDNVATTGSGKKDGHHRRTSEANETIRISSSQQPQGKEAPDVSPEKTSRIPSTQMEESVPLGSAEKGRPSPVIPKTSSRRQQVLLSPQESMASVAGSGTSEHADRKSFWKTNVAVSEDLRIVSPETDSGFVGSEASRVSPLAQLSKYRSSQSRSHGMLGKLPPRMTDADTLLHLASKRIESTAMESPETGVSASHTQPEGSTQRRGLHSRGTFQMGSPPQWTNSVASEMEPGTDSTHTDSDGEVHNRSSSYRAHPDETRGSPSFSATLLTPARTSWHGLLDSRLERDQAIAALKSEVSQLRQSLEKTLQQSPGPPKQSSSPHGLRTQLPFQSRARIPKSAKLMGKTSRKGTVASEEPHPETKPEGQEKRASLQPNESQLDFSPSESDSSLLKPQKTKSQEATSSRAESRKQSTLQGPYTGTQYSSSTPLPRKPKVHKGSDSCPHCQEITSQPEEEPEHEPNALDPEGCRLPSSDLFRPTLHSARKKTEPCPLCKDTKNRRSKTAHGVDHSRETTSSQDHREEKKPHIRQQPHQSGLWYWALPSPAASISYIPTVPLAAYLPSSAIYCSPTAPTSASSPAGVPINIPGGYQASTLGAWPSQQQPPQGHSCSLMFNFDEMQDLNWALNRAINAAKGVKLTTKRMNRSLASELSKARHLRGSCLF